MPTFNNKSSSSSSSSKYNNNNNKNINSNNNSNNMSAMIEQPATFSISKKKSSRLSRPRPTRCSIYTDVIIPAACSNNKEVTSPIPSGHLETSTRFWQFRVEEGLITYVRYGNIRADGTLKERATHIQQHPCYGDARQFVEDIVDEKIKAGYVGWTRW